MRTHLHLSIGAVCIAALLSTGSALAEAPTPGGVPLMKAIVYRNYGSPDVLRLEEIPKPVPTDDQILVRVRAASVNPLDWHFMEGIPYIARPLAFGLFQPSSTRLGVDYAGTVEAVGKNVTQFKPGDDVFGIRNGALAEYICVRPELATVLKPAGLTFEQAASIPVAAITALQGLRDRGNVQPGQKVLINGASGGVGTFAVQIAKSLGADVTGVCSGRNAEMVRSLGASQIIDYTKDDFTKGAERYDVILDNVGNRLLSENLRVLKPNGIYVLIGGGGPNDGRWVGPMVRPLKALLFGPFVSQKMGMMLADVTPPDLAVMAGLIQAGKVTPVIDRSYKLSQVPEAMRYLEEGHARGKVIITMETAGDTSPSGAAPLSSSVSPATSSAAIVTSPLGAKLIALALFAILIGVPGVPIIAAFVLNRGFKRRNPGKRPFRWGYYFAAQSFIAGIGLGLFLESGLTALFVCGAVYAVLAWLFAQRHHWAWIALTLLSLNPVAWLINFIYLRKRWAED